jgi:hypothetical protein
MRSRLAVMALGGCLVGALVDAIPGQPASASAVDTVTVSSATSSLWFKTVDARCPDGTEVYGGGARILDGNQVVTFLAMHPYKSNRTGVSGYYAQAAESTQLRSSTDFTGDWTLQAFARCGTGLSGVQHVSTVSTFADRSSYDYSATAQCPPGKVVVGSGFRSSYISVPVHWIRPINDGTAVQVVLHEDNLNNAFHADPLTVTAHAVCASPPDGWQIVVDAVDLNDTDPQQRTAWCPTGQVVLGGGLTKSDLGWAGYVRVTGFYPHWSGAYFSTEAGSLIPDSSALWFATGAWAICANL